MSEKSYKSINNIEELNDNLDLIVKTKSDILEELNFKTDDDKFLCESIIDNLESTVFNNVRDGLTVSIPYIGTLRKNPIRELINDNKQHLSNVRKCLSKEEYKSYMREYITDAKIKQKAKDRLKYILKQIRSKNKNKYEKYYSTFGRAYAELYLNAIYWMKEIPFDAEVEEMFQKLSNKDEFSN